MLRQDRNMKAEEAKHELLKGKWGVLSTCADGIPYGVPLNYYYSPEDNALFFHCAKKGRKLDNLIVNNNVSFTVVTEASIIEEKFTSLYRSVIVTGHASIVRNDDDKLKRFKDLCSALAPSFINDINISSGCFQAAEIVRIDISNINCKGNC